MHAEEARFHSLDQFVDLQTAGTRSVALFSLWRTLKARVHEAVFLDVPVRQPGD